jgi:hypothetical protein
VRLKTLSKTRRRSTHASFSPRVFLPHTCSVPLRAGFFPSTLTTKTCRQGSGFLEEKDPRHPTFTLRQWEKISNSKALVERTAPGTVSGGLSKNPMIVDEKRTLGSLAMKKTFSSRPLPASRLSRFVPGSVRTARSTRTLVDRSLLLIFSLEDIHRHARS